MRRRRQEKRQPIVQSGCNPIYRTRLRKERQSGGTPKPPPAMSLTSSLLERQWRFFRGNNNLIIGRRAAPIFRTQRPYALGIAGRNSFATPAIYTILPFEWRSEW